MLTCEKKALCRHLLNHARSKADRQRLMREVLAEIPYQQCGITVDVIAQNLFDEVSDRTRQRIRATIAAIWAEWRILIAETRLGGTDQHKRGAKEYWIDEPLSRRMTERRLRDKADGGPNAD